MSDMDILKAYTSGNYLKFQGEEPIEGIYKGVKVEDDPFAKKPGDKRLVYTLEINGKEAQITSKSRRLATAMLKSGAKAGDRIGIVRHGLGFETDYEVRKL